MCLLLMVRTARRSTSSLFEAVSLVKRHGEMDGDSQSPCRRGADMHSPDDHGCR